MTRRLLMLLVVCLTLASSRAQPGRSGGPELPGWVLVRLEALRPNDAWAYFLLGEEVSYELPSTRGRDLARTLFVLAYHLDPALGPHVCLALADMTAAPDERQWLIAMAESMGVGSTRSGGSAPSGADSSDEEARSRLAEGLRALRAEDGRALREVAAAPTVSEYLAGLAETDPALASAITEARQRATSLSGCPRCRGQRVVSESANKNTRTLCPRCGGNPGLALDETLMLASLRTESRLRRVEPTTWSGVLVLQEDRPLRDVRPDDLARAYRVDPDATVWSGESGWQTPGPPPPTE